MKIALIAALASNRAIGLNNQMPWHLSADLKRFKAITLGKPVLMGRKTHESIGRPLPGRHNIILTRQPDYRAAGCTIAHTLEQALACAASAEELMVIGGATLYQKLLPQADRLYLTHIDKAFPGDTFFPAVDWTDWRASTRQTVDDDPTVDFVYRFITWERAVPPIAAVQRQ